jgi:hypothetical protein
MKKKKGPKKTKKPKKSKKPTSPKTYRLNGCIYPYPGTEDNDIIGEIEIKYYEETEMFFKFDIEGLEEEILAKVQIHEGTSCNSEELIGDVRFNTDNPWDGTTNSFEANDKGDAIGGFEVDNGYLWGDNQWRAVTVTTTTRTLDGDEVEVGIGCGKLRKGKKRPKCYKRKRY